MTVDERHAGALVKELLELTTLALPRPPLSFELAFAPSDDGARRALTDLRARPLPGASARPELGFTDAEILDGINAVLGEVTSAVLGDDGPMRGVVRAQTSGWPMAYTVEVVPDGRAPAYTRVIDASELFTLVYTPALFAALAETEDEEAALWARTEAVLPERARFGIDPVRGRVDIERAGQKTRYRAAALGTYHNHEGSFLWAWANDPMPAVLKEPVDVVRREATAPGLAAFTHEEHQLPATAANRLLGHAGVRLGAHAILRAPVDGPQGPLGLYLALFLDDA